MKQLPARLLMPWAALIVLASLWPPAAVSAQELEPGSYQNAPIDTNALFLNYGFSTGNVLVESTLPIEGATAKVHGLGVGYLRSFGVFGRSEKAGRVVPNKVFDALACGRPVVTAAGDGARELLRDGETALLTPAGDPAALAAALRRLLDGGERARLGQAGLGLYRRAFTPAAVAGDLLAALEAV
jgi:hypothetical protein